MQWSGFASFGTYWIRICYYLYGTDADTAPNPDPDPSFNKKIIQKNLDFYSTIDIVASNKFLPVSLKTDVSRLSDQKNNFKKETFLLASGKPTKKRARSTSRPGAGSRSVIQSYGSADPDPNKNGTVPGTYGPGTIQYRKLKGSDQWEGKGCRRSRNHYMLVGEVVLDVFFVILMGYHLVWTVIYCSTSKAKKKNICSK